MARYKPTRDVKIDGKIRREGKVFTCSLAGCGRLVEKGILVKVNPFTKKAVSEPVKRSKKRSKG